MGAISLLISNPISRKTFDFVNLFVGQKSNVTFYFKGQYNLLYKLLIKLVYSPYRVLFFKEFKEVDSVEIDPIFIPLEEDFILDFYSFIDTNKNIRFLLPSEEVFKISRDKLKLSDFLSKKNPDLVPKSYKSICPEVLPLIIKPRHGSGSRGIIRLERINSSTPSFNSDTHVIQELLTNSRTVIGVFALAKAGEVITYYVHERIHTYPSDGGVTVFSRIRNTNFKIQKLVDEVVKELRWDGLLMLELMLGNDQSFKVIEINPRLWGSILLSSASEQNPIFEYVRFLSPTTIVSKTPYVIKKQSLFWLFPYGIRYVFNKRTFSALRNKEALFINFSNSSLLRALFFHLVLYVFKFSRKVDSF